MAEKEKSPKSIDPATLQVLQIMENDGVDTAWDRLEAQGSQCKFGREGLCCRICNMGPCRITAKAPRGVCGADADTIVARNFLRMVAAGTAAHSDHGRGVAHMFQAMANDHAKDFQVKDPVKLREVATEFGVDTDGREVQDIAKDLAELALAEFGKPSGEQTMAQRAPAKRLELWRKQEVMPRAIDREVVECLHRSTMGVDQDYRSILQQAARTALADGWGGSMLASELQDIMFGTPKPRKGPMNLGVIDPEQVNIVVHGHEPILSEMVVAATRDPEMIAKAKEAGATGINVCGICCTANELLGRHGVPIAGNFLAQELAVATGAVDLMIVDVQCVMQGLAEVANCYHTSLFTVSEKARIPGVEHRPMDEEHALDQAKEVVGEAITRFTKRDMPINVPKEKTDTIIGFSHETIQYMLGGRFRSGYGPLNDNIINGRIRGVVGVVGCTNPKFVHDQGHVDLVAELIKRDCLVLTTGCSSIACGKCGMMLPEAAVEMAGPGLQEVCEAVGIPPVLAMGSCVDNSRILVAATEMVHQGGLGDDLSELPVAGACMSSMSEKAIAIGQYFVASGALVVFNKEILPIGGSENVQKHMFSDTAEALGGRWAVAETTAEAADIILNHIERKRDALGINAQAERKLFGMEERRQLTF